MATENLNGHLRLCRYLMYAITRNRIVIMYIQNYVSGFNVLTGAQSVVCAHALPLARSAINALSSFCAGVISSGLVSRYTPRSSQGFALGTLAAVRWFPC